MKDNDNTILKTLIPVVIVVVMISAISIAGILWIYKDKTYPWHIWYEAEYENELNFSSIIQILQQENVSYEIVNEDSLWISYGKGINNETIERTTGGITNGVDYYYVSISLNESKYPPVTNKEDLEPQKSLLEESMNYITKLIYESTGMWPMSKKFGSSRLGA